MGKFIGAALGAAALLAAIAPAVGTATPGVVGYNFEKRRVDASEAPHRLRRRSNTVTATLTNEVLLYFINVTVGTPGQAFSLQIDTGSSDIWFPSVDADICTEETDGCPYGTYDSSKSSTYSELASAPQFEIQYVDGTEIEGDFISDVLNIGSTKLTNMTMAVATQANTRGVGIMGIGFQSGEAEAEEDDFTYPNVINVLKNEGFINTLAYSLWLDDLDANTGSILFGGVDTSKYSGNLVALPIQVDSDTDAIDSFTVAWTGLTVSGSGQDSDFSPSSAQAAILDSGTTDTLLPDAIAEKIFNGVGVLSDETYGNVVPCKLADDDLTFSFQFGGASGPIVNVSLSEFVTPLETTDGSTPTYKNGDKACSFAIDAAGDDPILFGDSFLRSAYVVYDLENQLIGLAQTNFNGGSSNVVVFSASSSGIPGVTSTATGASVAQTASDTGIPQVTEATVTNTGDVGSGATSRSATFHLSTATTTDGSGSTSTGSSSSSSSSSKSAANPNLRASSIEGTTIVAAGVVMAGLVFGSGLMYW
ncbi:aspartic-type endopeptidase [Exophiala viscosa]|uniref:Probable aspartic-type endopeptidase OPSB n=1 Tax=Exophiala viscosa TaxID=2486360 RepID=A0AAN6DLT6_9EURO|nr:aspartic-type endopeptidase [Exophiala viscosa]KAI1620827.1 aspartic-type endopeptidase [Exophiala viscosa]